MKNLPMAAAVRDMDIQVILVILIGLAYGVAAVVKKINAWVKQHRFPPKGKEKAAPFGPPQHPPTPQLTAAPPEKTLAESQSVQTTLMKELKKALGGLELGREKEPDLLAEPKFGPIPSPVVKTPPPIPREYDSEFDESAQAIRTTSDGKRVTSTGIVVQDAAKVARVQFDHLAVLKSPQDLNRAILMHEILAPPRSRRPMWPRRR